MEGGTVCNRCSELEQNDENSFFQGVISSSSERSDKLSLSIPEVC